MLALAAFFLLGAVLGGMVAARGAAAMGSELRRYLESYLALRIEGAPSSAAVWQTMVCFFRASAAVFLLGFASIGVALIPAVCAAQGFLYAYSLLCFASGLGQDGFFLLPVLFALRLMLVLPCTLLLGSAAWETSRGLAALSVGGGKRAKGVTYGKRYFSQTDASQTRRRSSLLQCKSLTVFRRGNSQGAKSEGAKALINIGYLSPFRKRISSISRILSIMSKYYVNTIM